MVFLPMSALLGVPPVPAGDTYSAFDINPEAGGSWGFVQIQFYPSSPGNGGFDFSYPAGTEPNGEWSFFERFTEIEHTGNDQIWCKVDITSVISGTESATNLEWGQGGAIGQWVDLWDNWELEFSHRVVNGVPEIITVDISLAKDNGAGAPDLATTEVRPFTLSAYRGSKDYLIQDTFTGTNGDLENHSPNIDRRDDGGADATSGWRDLYYEESDFDHGYMAIQNGIEVESRSGSTDDLALYVIDAKKTDFQFAASVEWDATSGGSGGIAGRVQDTDNFWLLAVKNPDATDPILGLYKVASGVHTLEASVTMTGVGPLTGLNDAYPLRLTFEGNDITGEMGFSDSSVNIAVYDRPVVTLTDSTYNTETDIGIWADGIDTIFQEMSLFEYPPGGFSSIVWDTTPVTSSKTDTGTIYNNCYFYEGSNGQTGHPYHSTMGHSWDPILYEDVINWRLVSFSTNLFVLKASAVSGDTAGITIREYGTTITAFDTWMDLYRCDIAHEVGVSESQSAVIDVTIAIDDGTGNPVSGTEVTKRITFNSTSTGP